MDIDIIKLRKEAFDYLFDAIVVVDLQGIIIDWNKGAEVLYGYPKDRAIGRPVNILHVPEDSNQITAEVISAVEKHGKWSGEIRMLRANGTIGWIESMCVPIKDENNQVIGALGINRDITKRKSEVQQLEHLAHYDQLTDIPNRYLLLDRLTHLIKKSERNKERFALCFVDVDKFKVINDTKGHVFGDQVLIEISLLLKKFIRNSDTVARFGGDEFIILFENISYKQDSALLLSNLAKSLNTSLDIKGEAINITCSLGVAIFPDDGVTTDTLLNAADHAMYLTKKVMSVTA